MRNLKETRRYVLALLAVATLVLGACKDDETTGGGGATDTGGAGGDGGVTDTGGGGTDTGVMDESMMDDTTMADDTGTPPEDTGGVGAGECVNEADGALLAMEGFQSAVGASVQYCATTFSECLLCINDPTQCGADCMVDSPDPSVCNLGVCVANCITNYTDGSATNADVDTALQTVRDSGLSSGCTGCFANITSCLAGSGCTAFCLADAAGCDCNDCACGNNTEGNNCPDLFAACSGLEPYFDCGDELDALCE